MARRAPSRARRAARPRAVPAPPAPAPAPLLVPARIALAEPPHAHAVCRACGRIAEVELSGFDTAQLTDLATGSPDGWAVEGISLSLTGLCPRCRRGLASP